MIHQNSHHCCLCVLDKVRLDINISCANRDSGCMRMVNIWRQTGWMTERHLGKVSVRRLSSVWCDQVVACLQNRGFAHGILLLLAKGVHKLLEGLLARQLPCYGLQSLLS